MAAKEPISEEKKVSSFYEIITFPEMSEQLATGFTVENVKNIYDNLRMGLTLKDCANLIRLPALTLNKWYSTNYCNFAHLVNEATTINKKVHVGRVFSADDNTKVRASQWWLERKHKDEYTKETVININHNVINTTAKVIFENATRFITDPDDLKLFVQSVQNDLAQVNTSVLDEAKVVVDAEYEEATDQEEATSPLTTTPSTLPQTKPKPKFFIKK